MTYENFCGQIEFLKAEEERLHLWAEKASRNLMEKIAPRVSKLGRTSYAGCGFHYSLEQTLGKLIANLAITPQFTANHCGKIEEDIETWVIYEVLYEGLLEDVRKAERSARKLKGVTP
jgi:hypothetical protein